MAEHSQYLIRPSELHRLSPCPGSLAMQHGIPEPESEAAIEGTAVHEAAAVRFQGLKFAAGDRAQNGTVFTTDMLDGADLFHRACMNRYRGEWVVERPMPCNLIHAYCGGTPDAWAYDAVKHHIYLGDLKWGHRYVDAYGNLQLIAYLAGIIEALQIDGLQEQHIGVTLFIVQPRAYRPGGDVTQWQFTLSDIRPWLNQIRDSVSTALVQGAACKPGPHCRDCLAASKCVALQRESASILASQYPAERYDLDHEQTGRELTRLAWALHTLQVRVEGLEAQADEFIRQGKAVPGWVLERSGGKVEWHPDHAKNIINMAKLMTNVDILKEIKPMTPKQAKAAGFDGEAMGLTVTKSGTAKLKPFGANNPLNGVTQHGE